MTGGPLSHLRVLDLTLRLAGPYGTQVLGDLGAEVIKLEPPGGDPTRRTPPHYVAGDSTYYLSINRNKRSIIVDLKTAEGRAVATRLIAKCDVLIENNRPGVMARLGLAYADLKEEFPGLVYCSISGFGQDGPDRERAALDPIVQALSGGMSITGESGGKPVRAGIPIGDICAGMYGVIAILAALNRRDRTGTGDYIDIAMLDVQVAMLSYQAAVYLQSGDVPGPQGRSHDSYALSHCFTAGDGIDVFIAANQPKAFAALCALLGATELMDDPRFATPSLRNANKSALRAVLDVAFQRTTAADVVAAMDAVGAPAATINTIDRAFAEPQVRHRGMLMELTGARPDERLRVAGDPIKLNESHRDRYAYPPHAGADTRAVLRDIAAYSDAEIDALLSAGVVLERLREADGREF